jgi:hypothetical protein
VRAAKEAETAAIQEFYCGVDDPIRRSCLDDDIARLVAAVAARVTAELLASGTPLWVATDAGSIPSEVYGLPPLVLDEDDILIRNYRSRNGSGAVRLTVQLTPPGTVHQAVLLMKPEATE